LTWISKDSSEYHYYVNHHSICNSSDILQDMSYTYDTSENPDTKCLICKGILKSKQCINISLQKLRNEVKEAKFLQKYKTSPLDMLVRYMTNPENIPPFTLKKLVSSISSNIDGIDIKDILSEGIISGKILYKDGAFHPAIFKEITL